MQIDDFYFFFCLIVLAKVSGKNVNRSGKSGHPCLGKSGNPCLVPDFR